VFCNEGREVQAFGVPEPFESILAEWLALFLQAKTIGEKGRWYWTVGSGQFAVISCQLSVASRWAKNSRD
jgi:hypothetical protein